MIEMCPTFALLRRVLSHEIEVPFYVHANVRWQTLAYKQRSTTGLRGPLRAFARTAAPGGDYCVRRRARARAALIQSTHDNACLFIALRPQAQWH